MSPYISSVSGIGLRPHSTQEGWYNSKEFSTPVIMDVQIIIGDDSAAYIQQAEINLIRQLADKIAPLCRTQISEDSTAYGTKKLSKRIAIVPLQHSNYIKDINMFRLDGESFTEEEVKEALHIAFPDRLI